MDSENKKNKIIVDLTRFGGIRPMNAAQLVAMLVYSASSYAGTPCGPCTTNCYGNCINCANCPPAPCG